MHVNNKILIQRPDSESRVLLEGRVKLVGDDCIACEFNLQGAAVVEEQELLVYFEERRKFMQQSVRVTAVRPEEEFTVVAFEFLGEPVSAENRECFRVSAVMSDLSAMVGETTGCPVLDVSATGFAVSTTTVYEIGDVVSVVLDFAGEQLAGTASVESISRLEKGQIRYGMNCKPEGDSLQEFVNGVCLTIQREQLRRLAGLT